MVLSALFMEHLSRCEEVLLTDRVAGTRFNRTFVGGLSSQLQNCTFRPFESTPCVHSKSSWHTEWRRISGNSTQDGANEWIIVA